MITHPFGRVENGFDGTEKIGYIINWRDVE